MLGVGLAQSDITRLGSSANIPIRAADVPETDGPKEVASASPCYKKKGGLLKSLKKIGTFLSGHSSINPTTGATQAGSDPSRNGLAHALSTPDIPVPVSVSANPSPSYMDMARGQRLGLALRASAIGSPPIEPHSPCSPFPASGQFLLKQNMSRTCSISNLSEAVSVTCNIQGPCRTPPVEVPPHLTAQSSLTAPSCSPVGVASPLGSTLSPYDSCSSGSGRLKKLAYASSTPAPTAITSPPTCSSSSSSACAPASCHTGGPVPRSNPSALTTATRANPAVTAHPHPPAPPPPPPPAAITSTLLALNPALPGPMRRRVWSLEDYQVQRRLYKGSSASVYKATCLRSGKQVALKVYFLTRVPRNVVHMIKREIELHAPLVHPHVVQLYGAFLEADRIVLVGEYAARGDLFHLLRQMGGRMSEQQASELVMRPFLDGLAYLHGHGVCHRDIKPENLLYSSDWRLKVADFGVSINLAEERAVTRAGTLDYMAPEVSRCPLKAQPEDNKDDHSLAYTSAVDIWAAGVLAYELLVGFTPVLGTPAATTSSSSCPPSSSFSSPKPLLHFPASLSPAARSFILAALSEDPGDRPTAQELLRHPWISGGGRGSGGGGGRGSAGGEAADKEQG